MRRLRLNITVKLLGYLLVAGVVPLMALGYFAFVIAKDTVIAQAEAENTRTVANFATYFRLYHDQIDDLAANIAGNEALGKALRDADTQAMNGFDILTTRAQIGYALNNYVRVKGLVALDLFSLKGEHFHVGETLSITAVSPNVVHSLLREASAATTPSLWFGVGNNINGASRHKTTSTVLRTLRYFSPELGVTDTVGLLVITLNDDIMREYLRASPLAAGTRLMMIDRAGRVALHSTGELLGRELAPDLLTLVRSQQRLHRLTLDGEEVLMDVLPLAPNEGTLVAITPRRLVTAHVDALATTTLTLVLLGLFAVAALTLRFARTVVTPIREVSEGFSRLQHTHAALPPPLPNPATDDEIGQLVRGFNDHLQALKAQQEAARELQLLEISRRETETMLVTAIDAIDEAFVVYDAEDRLVFFNEKYRDMYQSSAEIIQPGNSFEEIIRFGVVRGQYRAALGREEEWVRERLTAHRSGDTLLEQKLDSGRWLRIVERKTVLGQIVGFRIDITAIKQAQEAAEAASRAKSEFLANMSHEIRTPMNAMLGMMQFARDAGSEDERRSLIDKALDSAQGLLTIINDILDFSKIEAGQLAIERLAFAPTRLLADVCDLYLPAASEKNVRLTVEAGDVPPVIWGDSFRLRQVLQNLTSNALKFTDHGEVRLKVSRCARSESASRDDTGTMLRWTVTDTGIGIPADSLDKLFVSFSQADASTTRRFGGTGLGLAICKRLVELMGGRIGVDSEFGKGSCFWVELPCDEAGESDLPRQEATNLDDLLLALQGRHVLLVDDNRLNQEVATQFLRRAGMTASVASNGSEALERLAQERFDGVLMDCQMPVMDGYEATRRLRADPRFTRLPVIAMTANALAGDRERSLEAGMNDHLTKPLVAGDFYRMLARWLLDDAHLSMLANVTAAPSVAAEPADVRLDVEQAIAQMAGLRDVYNDVVSIFPEDAQENIVLIKRALASGDWTTARRGAHSIKGMAASIGAAHTRTLALQLEMACKAEDSAASEVDVPQLEAELAALYVELATYLASPAAEV